MGGVFLIVLIAFLLVYPVTRFRLSEFDRRIRWQVLLIRWTGVLLALACALVWEGWDRYAQGDPSTRFLVTLSVFAAFYALGEWVVRRRLSVAGIEVREGARRSNY